MNASLLRSLSAPLLAALLLTPQGCAPPRATPARLAYLNAEHKALQFRLAQARATARQDERVVTMKRSTIERARRLDAGELSDEGAFLSLHHNLLDNLLSAVLPLALERDDLRFAFDKYELELTPGGIFANLSYAASGKALRRYTERAVRGSLRVRLELQRDETSGALRLHATPQLLKVDDRDYQAARYLQERYQPQSFAGVIPDLPVPIGLPPVVRWEKRGQRIDVRYDPTQALILPKRLLLPLQLDISEAPPQPEPPAGDMPDPGAAPAPADGQPPAIPVGNLPSSAQPATVIPVGRTPTSR